MTFRLTHRHLFYTDSYEYRMLRGGLEDWFALTRRDQNLRRKPMTVSRNFGIGINALARRLTAKGSRSAFQSPPL